MKKKLLLIIILIIYFLILIIKFFPFGTEFSKDTSGRLTIPKLSTFEEECCMFSAHYKSIRSKYIIQKELDKTMKNYKKCNRGYYDEENDISITEYGVERGIIFNHFYIVYDKGNYCSDDSDNKKQMTLDDVIELSKKGDDLTFADFEKYYYINIGSGLIIEKFIINDNYDLYVGGSSSVGYVKLKYKEDKTTDDYKEIDIRKENVEEFIEQNKK